MPPSDHTRSKLNVQNQRSDRARRPGSEPSIQEIPSDSDTEDGKLRHDNHGYDRAGTLRDRTKGQEVVGPAWIIPLASLLAYALSALLLAHDWDRRPSFLQDVALDLSSAWWYLEPLLELLRTGEMGGSSLAKLGQDLGELAQSAHLPRVVWLCRMLYARNLLYQTFRNLREPYGRSRTAISVRRHSSLVALSPRRSLVARIIIICFCLDDSMYCKGMLLLLAWHEYGAGNLSWLRPVVHAISDTCLYHGALHVASVRPGLWV